MSRESNELATPDQIQESISSDTNIEMVDSVGLKERASDKVIEIENRFNTVIHAAIIELEPPIITFSKMVEELPNWENTNIVHRWHPIENQYKNAQKIGELYPKFGRIQRIVEETKDLVKRFPRYFVLKRVLAYFCSISENWDEALHYYQESAIILRKSDDWLGVALSALKLNKEELVVYSLEEYFYRKPTVDKPKVWCVFVKFLEKFNNLPAFCDLCAIEDINDDEIELLLDTAIYLLKRKNRETFAIEIVQKWLADESPRVLLERACQKLDIHPTKSYSKFSKVYDQFLKKYTIVGYPLYHEAKNADQSGNFALAELLYQECIRRNIRRDTSIMDLVSVLVRSERHEAAAKFQKENRPIVKNKQALDNHLVQILWQHAKDYIKSEKYQKAQSLFEQVDKLRPGNITVKRNLAFCLSKQEKYDLAKSILNKIQDTSPDAKTAELLYAIETIKDSGGEFVIDYDDIISRDLSNRDLSDRDLSDFANLFLDRCMLEGTPQGGRRGVKYKGTVEEIERDINTLEGLAKGQGYENPRGRSLYLLSAARVYFDVGNGKNAYPYLCRSFTSMGDDSRNNRNLDTAREWYYEALRAYDRHYTGIRPRILEQDAVYALSRFLLSYLDDDIPVPEHRDESESRLTQQVKSIESTMELVVHDHEEKENVFNAIVYLLGSQFAEDYILKCLHKNQDLRNESLKYLRSKGLDTSDPVRSLEQFTSLWRQLRNINFNEAASVSIDLKLLREKFDLTTAWLENTLERGKNIPPKLFFELDRSRITKLWDTVIKDALDLCKTEQFHNLNHLGNRIDKHCQLLLDEIEKEPTKLSIVDIRPIVEIIQKKVKERLKERSETLKPQLKLELSVVSYPHSNQQINVRIAVENERGRSPAEELELIVDEDQEFYKVTKLDIKLNDSLPGGEQKVLEVPLQLTPDTLDRRAFSLPVRARYRTHTEESVETPIQRFSISLYSEDEFEVIKNHYNVGSGIVKDGKMFVGRTELINNIAQTIHTSRTQSECVLIYGQKRSGKSSILHHLESALKERSEKEKSNQLLILNIGNISDFLGYPGSDPEREFLHRILSMLKTIIDKQVSNGSSSLDFQFPRIEEFRNSPNPRLDFIETFDKFKQCISESEDWRNVRLVLLIDEFQYIYELFINGKIDKSFMDSWKALLEKNYFNVVLVGQDVMPKFKERFPNQMIIARDERITYLTDQYAKELIENPIRIGDWKEGESRYCEQSVQKILDLTAGSPFYIQILCYHLVNHLNSDTQKSKWVTDAHVDYIKNELIRNGKENIVLNKESFDNLISSGDKSQDALREDDVLIVLTEIAKNSGRTNSCSRNSIISENLSTTQIDTILDDLVKREVIERDSGNYRIRVGLFKEWLIVNG